MKYTSQVIVAIPIEAFIKKLNNHSNMKLWQRGLVSYEHVSGNPGNIGAKMKLNYLFGKQKMTVIETIIDKKLPNELHATFDYEGMHNVQKNYFTSTAEGHTKWVCENEFLPTSFYMRIMTAFTPSSFRKQSMIYLTDFKNFSENNICVN